MSNSDVLLLVATALVGTFSSIATITIRYQVRLRNQRRAGEKLSKNSGNELMNALDTFAKQAYGEQIDTAQRYALNRGCRPNLRTVIQYSGLVFVIFCLGLLTQDPNPVLRLDLLMFLIFVVGFTLPRWIILTRYRFGRLRKR